MERVLCRGHAATATASGVQGDDANDPSPCSDVGIDPAYGRWDSCRASLPSGSTCQWATQCRLGVLSAATCSEDRCEASSAPTYDSVGDYRSGLASGLTCQVTCDVRYTARGRSSCSAGVLTAATWSANPCDALVAPAHGSRGDCRSELASGSACEPQCDAGYTASGRLRLVQGE